MTRWIQGYLLIGLSLAGNSLGSGSAKADTLGSTGPGLRDPAWVEHLPKLIVPLPRLSPLRAEQVPLATSAVVAPEPTVTPPPASPPVVPPPPVAVVVAPPVEPAVEPAPPPSITNRPPPTPPVVLVPQEEKKGHKGKKDDIEEVEEVEIVPPTELATALAAVTTRDCPAGQDGVAACAPAVYRWQIQLFAGRLRDRVEADQKVFARKQQNLLRNLELFVVQRPEPVNGQGGGLYRLRAKPLADRQTAHQKCRRFKQRGVECLVVKSRLVAPAAVTDSKGEQANP